MDDLIRRRDAIDAIVKQLGIKDESFLTEQEKTIVKVLRCMPSEQQKIIRCKDCIYQSESWSGIKYCEAHGDHIGKDYDYCSNARRKDNG